MKIFSTLTHLHDIGEADGLKIGSRDGMSRELAALLLRAGKKVFGPADDSDRGHLNQLADRQAVERLQRMRDRLLVVRSWADLREGCDPPTTRPADPDWLIPVEIDLEPMAPSIDSYMKVRRKSGGESIIHMRLQRSYQENLGQILYKESKRLQQKYHLEVQPVVLLMWEGADGPPITGEYQIPAGGVFRYNVKRLWEEDIDALLENPAVQYLAPLGKGAPERLHEVVRRMELALDARGQGDQDQHSVWLVAYGSMGLRYPAAVVNEALAHKMPFIYSLKGCRSIRSQGYQEGYSRGLKLGALEAACAWVLTLGCQRLGEPSAEVARALAAVGNLERLEQMAARVLKAESWAAVLAPN